MSIVTPCRKLSPRRGARQASLAFHLGPKGREAGLTLLEMIVVLWIISLLSIVMLATINGRIEKARLARCMTDMRSVQSTVWSHSDGVHFLHPKEFWQIAWAGKQPGPYYYFPTNFDRNSGHGNDVVDLCDDDNPGKSTKNRPCKDIDFVLLCQHDHGTLVNYVYLEDEGPPTFAGWSPENNPGYDQWVYRPPKYDQ